jgi:hypothetical protein
MWMKMIHLNCQSTFVLVHFIASTIAPCIYISHNDRIEVLYKLRSIVRFSYVYYQISNLSAVDTAESSIWTHPLRRPISQPLVVKLITLDCFHPTGGRNVFSLICILDIDLSSILSATHGSMNEGCESLTDFVIIKESYVLQQ